MTAPGVTSVTTNTSASTPMTVSLPGSSTAYVAVVCATIGGGTHTLTPPANWTALEPRRGGDQDWTSLYAYYANASSSPGTSWACTNLGNFAVAIVGLDAAISYIEDAWTDSTVDGPLDEDSPSLGADEAARIIRAVVSDVYGGPGAVNYPAGTSNQTRVEGTAGGDNSSVQVATSTVGGAGATGVARWVSTAGNFYRAVLGTIAVAAAGGGTDATVAATAIVTTTAVPAVTVTVTDSVVAQRQGFPPFFRPFRGPHAQPLQLRGDTATASTTSATVTPPAIVTTTALDAPAIQTGSTVAATAIVTTTAMPAPAVQQGQTVSATAIVTTAAMPAPAIQAGSTVVATTVTTTTAMPAPGVVVPGQVDPYQAAPGIAWMFLQPSGASLQLKGDATSPVSTTDATVTAVAIATTAALPAPAVQTGSTVAATAIATVTALPTPAVQTGSTVSATSVATVTAMPAPALSMGGSVTIPATAIATVTVLPAPAVQQGQTVSGTTIATVTAITAPTVTTFTNATVSATAVATVTALPVPTVSTTSSATVAGTTIATVIAFPTPTVSGNVFSGIPGNAYPKSARAVGGSAGPRASGGIIGSAG